MKLPVTIQFVRPTDARSWIGLGCYVLVLVLLWMMWHDKGLLRDDFFKTIATAIILNGWNSGPVGWAYQATKGGSEAAESSQRIAEAAASTGLQITPASAKEAAVVVAGAAQDKADQITGEQP